MDIKFNEIRTLFNNKLLNTRKSRFSFIKLYIINKYNIQIDAKHLKSITYGEIIPTDYYENEAYTLFTLYTGILDGKLFNSYIKSLNIKEVNIDIDNIINTIFNLYEINLKIIDIFMIMNYLLLNNKLPIINQYKHLKQFESVFKSKSGEELYFLLKDILINTNTLDINYYENLKETNKDLIIEFIKHNEELFKEKGHINSIILFGSYASCLDRFDSDIDLLVFVNDDLRFNEKVEGINFIKDLIEKRFNRIADIHEITNDLIEIQKNRIKDYITIF